MAYRTVKPFLTFEQQIDNLQLNKHLIISDRDKALKTLVSVIEAHLRPGCMLYRIGGDEFAVVCNRIEDKEVAAMMREIAAHMKETDYSFAEGRAEWENGADFKKVIAMADSYMYINKEQRKSQMEQAEAEKRTS